MMSMKGAECKIAYMKLESRTSEEDLPARKLYGDISIGNAGTVTGIFKIIAVLRILLQNSKCLQDAFWDVNLPGLD